ncbi:LysR family transcriptional regulator [Pigmentiphaga litoralis]|jgi:LysR family transcriptional regulator for bpeEF and oprC|uniref:LysR family transcriptional regulator for bpeEF and oprC n=1 Tax=Pigmentiphaga litoralis TaxID=516702 RepID=A0A7Y9LLU8_9BURK|nr:LysR family transcriptional regulator [Pigmentiphaga litoralis]NYE25447.1 LysR family transcriptional regulator for bpeEF and oprC [Pigmentiphaga litoralis]NYE80941.1 LysR family transcriptional regulator for bpeEF and oprC [Pigmentiphaga litoralis]GGX24637.1 LysR family transcriptional regulator [Pigmentiphaga litoralis]
MDKLTPIRAFLAVADAGSFTGAARKMGVSRSAVTGHVQELEQHLGVRLLNRTTRRVSLTREGERYAERAGLLLQGLATLDAEIQTRSGRTEGHLHVEMSESVANARVLPRLPEFVRAYPDVSLRISLNEGAVDPSVSGADIGLRVGLLRDSPLRFKLLGRGNYIMAASPSYLAMVDAPRHPNELRRHRLIDFWDAESGRPFDWQLVKGKQTVTFAAKGDLTVDNARAGLTCALAGLGVYEDLDFLLAQPLAEKRLVQVLPDWRRPGPPIAALFTAQRPTPPHVKAFVDFLASVFGSSRS